MASQKQQLGEFGEIVSQKIVAFRDVKDQKLISDCQTISSAWYSWDYPTLESYERKKSCRRKK